MVDIAQVSLSKGEISPIAYDRTDQGLYANAVAMGVNFFVRREGGMSNRPGLQYIANCSNNTANGSYLLPFIYNNAQAYLTEFSSGAISVYQNGALIQSGVSNNYTLTDLPSLRWAQSNDVLNVVVNTHPLAQLKRLTMNSFSFTQPQLLFGPFQDINTDGTTTVYASATQGVVTLTASKAIFQSSHVGALFYLQEQFLGGILPWVAGQTWSTASAGVAGAYCRSDGKIYLAVGPPGNGDSNTGNFQPVHTQGTQWDGNVGPTPGVGGFQNGIEWQFVSTNAGVALITQFISTTQVKAVVQSNKGVYSNFPPTVVGGPVSVHGPYTFSGDGSTTSFGALTASTSIDPNQFYVTVGGVLVDPSAYSISAIAGNIVFFTAPVTGTNNIVVNQVVGSLNNIYTNLSSGNSPTPMNGLCLSTYWAFGSFSSIQGYPGVATYYSDRLVLAATQLQPQSFFTSKTSDFLNFGVSSPQIDSDAITETLNARQQNPIVDMIPLNQLLLGTATATQLVTNSSADGTITPANISVVPQEFYGVQDVPVALTGSTAIYVQWGGRKIRDVVFQFIYGKFVGQELTLYAQHIFPFGTTCTRIAFAPEPFGLVFCVRSDGVMCVCTYLQEQQVGASGGGIIAWTRYVTAGNFEDVCVLPENGSFSVYVIVGRFINGVYQRYIERFAAREFAVIEDALFVDSALTYDGRNTSSTTMTLIGGSTWLAGDVGVLNASSVSGWAGFQSTDPANSNAVFLFDFAHARVRLRITSYISATSVNVVFLDPVPPSLQGNATLAWTLAKTNFAGLTNLPNQSVAIEVDGAVIAQQQVSASGTLTLPYAGGVVHAGLPYVSQIQSLNFNVQNQPSIRNVMKTIPRASVVVDASAPFFAGSSFDNLTQCSLREFEAQGFPTNLFTGVVAITPATQPSDDAALCIQMSDPAPLTVLGWLADVELGEAQ